MRRGIRVLVALSALLLLTLSLIPAATAQEHDAEVARKSCFRLDLSTGTTNPFLPDPIGTADPDWWVTSSPDPSLAVPAPVYSITPVTSWYSGPGANWVDPYNTGFGQSADGQYTGMDPAGDYVFATTFTLNGSLYTNFMLHLNAYAADNQVQLLLDGNPVGPAAGFGPPVSTPIGGPLSVPVGPGTHTLEAKVANGGWWVGLFVNAMITADCRPDLTISKKPLSNMVAGQNGTYALAVSNLGPGAAAGPIVVTDSLPAGATFISATGSGWTCSASGSTVTCTTPGPLASATSLPLIFITVTMPAGVPVVMNCASVDAKDDGNQQNNRDCVESAVDPGRPAIVCGVKFHDLNGNGVRDGGEPGLANWTIQVKDAAGNVIATATTGKDGSYCFKELKPGTYVIGEVQQNGWTQTAPLAPGTYTLTVVSNQDVQGLNFGNRARPDEECCLTFTFNAGVRDQFATTNGAEPASPSVGLQALLNPIPLVGFDATVQDRHFAHTFVLPAGNCVEAASLVIRVRPLGLSSLNANDAMALRFTGPTGSLVPSTPLWSAYFGAGNPGTMLLPNAWSSANYPAGQTIALNLGALPGGGNLLPALNSLRFLDVTVQDDTSVDYVGLRVKFCECGPTQPGGGSNNPNKTDLGPNDALPETQTRR